MTGWAADPTPFFVWLDIFAPHGDGVETSGDSNTNVAGPTAAHRHQGTFAHEPLPTSPNFNERYVLDKPSGIRNKPLLTSSDIAAGQGPSGYSTYYYYENCRKARFAGDVCPQGNGYHASL